MREEKCAQHQAGRKNDKENLESGDPKMTTPDRMKPLSTYSLSLERESEHGTVVPGIIAYVDLYRAVNVPFGVHTHNITTTLST